MIYLFKSFIFLNLLGILTFIQLLAYKKPNIYILLKLYILLIVMNM